MLIIFVKINIKIIFSYNFRESKGLCASNFFEDMITTYNLVFNLLSHKRWDMIKNSFKQHAI